MQGSFKATFTGSKSDISLLTGYLEENYPELIDTMELPDDFDERPDDKKTKAVLDGEGYINDFTSEVYEQICGAVPALKMEAYISWDCDGASMNKYTSKAGSGKVNETEGVSCASCGSFIEFDKIENFNDDGEPVCEKCAEGCFDDFE